MIGICCITINTLTCYDMWQLCTSLAQILGLKTSQKWSALRNKNNSDEIYSYETLPFIINLWRHLILDVLHGNIMHYVTDLNYIISHTEYFWWNSWSFSVEKSVFKKICTKHVWINIFFLSLIITWPNLGTFSCKREGHILDIKGCQTKSFFQS